MGIGPRGIRVGVTWLWDPPSHPGPHPGPADAQKVQFNVNFQIFPWRVEVSSLK